MEERLTEATKREPQEVHAHVEEDIAHAEMREHLARVMTALPPAQQQVIQLAFYKGMSQREIAAHTGIPLGTIKTRIELGLKKISEALPEKLRETAYALACDVAAADSQMTAEEARLLDLIRFELKIGKLVAAAIERGARARHLTV